MNAKEKAREKAKQYLKKNAHNLAERFIDDAAGSNWEWSFALKPGGIVDYWDGGRGQTRGAIIAGYPEFECIGTISNCIDFGNGALSIKGYMRADDNLFQDVVGEDFEFEDEDNEDSDDIYYVTEYLCAKYYEEDDEQAQEIFNKINDKNLRKELENRQTAIKEIMSERVSYYEEYIGECIYSIEEEILEMADNIGKAEYDR